jgi:hypothetical protein
MLGSKAVSTASIAGQSERRVIQKTAKGKSAIPLWSGPVTSPRANKDK